MTMDQAKALAKEYIQDMRNGNMETMALYIVEKNGEYRVACGERNLDRATNAGWRMC